MQQTLVSTSRIPMDRRYGIAKHAGVCLSNHTKISEGHLVKYGPISSALTHTYHIIRTYQEYEQPSQTKGSRHIASARLSHATAALPTAVSLSAPTARSWRPLLRPPVTDPAYPQDCFFMSRKARHLKFVFLLFLPNSEAVNNHNALSIPAVHINLHHHHNNNTPHIHFVDAAAKLLQEQDGYERNNTR